MLNINAKSEGTELTLALSGRLDTITAPDLENELNVLLDENDVVSLILDFGELEYVSSAGLRVLLAAEMIMKKRGGMKVRNVNENIMRIFDMTGLSDEMTIEQDPS